MIRTIAVIDGMMCSMCEAHVCDAIRRALPVKKVNASHTRQRAEILSEEPLDEATLRAAIDKTGYTVLGVSSEEAREKGFFARMRGK